MDIFTRKDDHLQLCLTNNVQSHRTTWLENVNLIHKAAPEIDFAQINLHTTFLQKKIEAPIIIGALTGGTPLSEKINKMLGTIAQTYKIPMMLGSQRIALEHPETKNSFQIAHQVAPDIPLIANIGASQITKKTSIQELESLVEMIKADALAIHLNSMQECLQPEGEPYFHNLLDRISEIRTQLSVPIIIKETGAGVDSHVAKKIFDTGVNIIDVAGVGGTSFSAVEYLRSDAIKNPSQINVGDHFWDWGIPTAASILEVRSVASSGAIIIGSGGIRTGVDIAKSISIGASLCAIAHPFLVHAMQSIESIDNYIKSLLKELKIAMFLTSCKDIEELKRHQSVLSGDLLKWSQLRNILKI